MSTNKRKDAAALFELIDKSTLKVPKGGNLKIPSWWSSKENPSFPATAPGGTARKGNAAPAPTSRGGAKSPQTVPAAVVKVSPSPASNPATNAEPLPAGAAQHRLFDPPPSNVTPSSSPSIRPPAPASAVGRTGGSVSAPPKGTAPTTGRIEPVAASKPKQVEAKVPSAAQSPKGVVPSTAELPEPPTRRVFAPLTMDQKTPPMWNRQHGGGALARVPRWAFFAGGAVIIVFVVAMGWLLFRGGKTPSNVSPAANASTRQAGAAGSAGGILPRGNQNPTTQRSVAPGGNVRVEPGVGRVFEPGQVRRDPALFYIWILQTPEEAIARLDADFIAQHGVDVAIEKIMLQNPNKKTFPMFVLTSSEGFPTAVAAEPLRKRIRDIGRMTEAYKKSPKASNAWDDAYPKNNLRSPATSSTPAK